MDNTLTVSMLNSLTKSELTALGKFLQSPFFTAKKFLYPLFCQMRSSSQSPAKSALAIFEEVFPKDEFGEGIQWNKALSDLNASILDFLTVSQLFEEPNLRTQAEVSALFKRKNGRLFQRKIGAALKDADAPEMTDGWQLRFWTLKQQLSYPFADRMKSQTNGLEDLEESLDLYYFISKLQMACNRTSQAQYLRLASSQAAFRQLWEQTAALDQSDRSALLTLYRALLYLLSAPEARFEAFFELLQKKGTALHLVELGTVVRFAFNYCIRRSREGEARAFGWYRQLFLWADTYKVWTAEASEELFLNTGVMFAKSQDAEGFHSFLEKCNAALPEDRREDAKILLQAYRYFYHLDFDLAARSLAMVDARHPRYTLLYHSLNVRNTYEQWVMEAADRDELSLSLERFKDFLERKDLFAESLRQSYITLIWFIKKLANSGQKQGITKEQLEAELKKKQPAQRDWVTAKIGELP